ncbi:MAG: hypothetical protein JG767_2033 [Deferribacteraceae bacterium]|jgi:hypothetical protein|nr:hypothetical protein [Deferribacteraceae bacterium]
MTLYLYLFILFINLLFAFRKRQSTLLTIGTLITILLFISGAGPEYIGQNDYINYKIRYDSIGNVSLFESAQVGYTFLMKVGNLLNLDFFAFRMLVTAICLLLLYKTVIKRYAYNSNYILLMYMMYPMIIDSEHFRNFIAMTIFLVAIRFLERNLLKDKIKFLVLVLIAFSIHTAFIFYTPLIFVNANDKNRLVKGIATGTIFLTIVAFLNNNQVPFLQLILKFFDDEKVIRYLSSRTNFGFLIPVILHLISIILVYWSRKVIIRKNFKTNIMDELNDSINYNQKKRVADIEFINLVFWINIIGIVFFPLYMMSTTFYRLARNFLILNFIVYSIASNKLKRGSAYKLIFNSTVIASVTLWLVMDLIITTRPERVLIQFFTRNLFFN